MGAAHYAAAVPLALGAAAAFGLAGFLEHQAARDSPPSEALRPRLLMDLLARPPFRWGVVLSILAFGLQVSALALAPLAVVQPLLVTGVLFYLGFASLSLHRRPDRRLVTGAGLAVAGLATFLLVAHPGGGGGDFGRSEALPLGLALVAIVAVALTLAGRLRGEYRALPIAAATAVCYGVTAGLIRSLLVLGEPGDVFLQWQLYAALIVAPAGFLLNQNAFQTGAIGSVAVAVITVGDPIVAIGVGVTWLDESLAIGPVSSSLQVASLLVVVLGVALLAGRAQQVAEHVRGGSHRVAMESK